MYEKGDSKLHKYPTIGCDQHGVINMPQASQQAVEEIRLRIGAALLEVQHLGAVHREAVARLNQAYMDLGEALRSHRVRPHSVEDVA